MISNLNGALPQCWRVPAHRIDFWLGKRRSYCVVIPVLNEGERIGRLLARMVVDGTERVADIVVVDGGSDDGSVDPGRLNSLGVRALLTKTGPGRLSAQLRCAYAFALANGYDGIVTIDGNDKDDPRAIPEFVEALRRGTDFVQASRFVHGGVEENTPPLRRFAIRQIHAPMLRFFSGYPWTDTTQGFRAYSRRILLDTRIAPFRDVFYGYELLAYLSYRVPRLGYVCAELPTERRYQRGQITSKIRGARGNLRVLAILIRACLGGYDPR